MRRTHEEEAAAAAYYEQHKDDPDIWEDDPDQPPVGVRRRTGVGARVTTRFSPDEAAQIRKFARARGVPLYTEAVRAAVMEAVSRPASSESNGTGTIGASLSGAAVEQFSRLARAEGKTASQLAGEVLLAYLHANTRDGSTSRSG